MSTKSKFEEYKVNTLKNEGFTDDAIACYAGYHDISEIEGKQVKGYLCGHSFQESETYILYFVPSASSAYMCGKFKIENCHPKFICA